jgi:predicted DNA-binding transcriptional regulator AlpA
MNDFLNEVEVADRWGMSHRTLQRWRSQRKGPPFLKLCGKVLYRLSDITNWENANCRIGEKSR